MYGNEYIEKFIETIKELTGVEITAEEVQDYRNTTRANIKSLEDFYKVDRNIYETAGYLSTIDGLLKEFMIWLVDRNDFYGGERVDIETLIEGVEFDRYDKFLKEYDITKEELLEAIFQNEYLNIIIE